MIDSITPLNQNMKGSNNGFGVGSKNLPLVDGQDRKNNIENNNSDGAPNTIPDTVRQVNDDKSAQGEKPNKADKLSDSVDKANKTVRIFNPTLHFVIHKETGRVMVQVIDKVENKIIREIPPEKILDMVARIQEMVGLLVDEFR